MQIPTLPALPPIVKYGVTGVLNTMIGLGTIFLLKWLAGLSDTLANLLGYIVGFAFSCFLNARWTFRYRGSLRFIVLPYAALIVFSYLINLLVVHAAIDVAKLNSYASQTLGVVPYALITYFGSKHLVFVKRARHSGYAQDAPSRAPE